MSRITQYILDDVRESGLTGTCAMVFKTLLVLLHLDDFPVKNVPKMVLQVISHFTSGWKMFSKCGNSKKCWSFFCVSGRGACDRWGYEGRWGDDDVIWTNFRCSIYRSKGSRVSTWWEKSVLMGSGLIICPRKTLQMIFLCYLWNKSYMVQMELYLGHQREDERSP